MSGEAEPQSSRTVACMHAAALSKKSLSFATDPYQSRANFPQAPTEAHAWRQYDEHAFIIPPQDDSENSHCTASRAPRLLTLVRRSVSIPADRQQLIAFKIGSPVATRIFACSQFSLKSRRRTEPPHTPKPEPPTSLSRAHSPTERIYSFRQSAATDDVSDIVARRSHTRRVRASMRDFASTLDLCCRLFGCLVRRRIRPNHVSGPSHV